MVQTTSPDLINKWTLSDPTSIVQASQSQGDSVQTALNKRERFTYVWPTVTERNAETTMVQGSIGYQVDTKTEYIYDNSAWRLATSYAEYSAGAVSVTNATYTALTGWTINSSNSTDATFTSVSAGVLTIVSPGIYAVSLTLGLGLTGGTTFADITTDAAHNNIVSISSFTGNVATVSVPFLRVTVANTPLYMWVYQTSGSTTTTTVGQSVLRVGRIS